MYKISYVFFENKCKEIENKMLKLIQEAFGNKHDELAKILLDDILDLYTSDDDPDIISFNMNKNGEDNNCRNY